MYLCKLSASKLDSGGQIESHWKPSSVACELCDLRSVGFSESRFPHREQEMMASPAQGCGDSTRRPQCPIHSDTGECYFLPPNEDLPGLVLQQLTVFGVWLTALLCS